MSFTPIRIISSLGLAQIGLQWSKTSQSLSSNVNDFSSPKGTKSSKQNPKDLPNSTQRCFSTECSRIKSSVSSLYLTGSLYIIRVCFEWHKGQMLLSLQKNKCNYCALPSAERRRWTLSRCFSCLRMQGAELEDVDFAWQCCGKGRIIWWSVH